MDFKLFLVSCHIQNYQILCKIKWAEWKFFEWFFFRQPPVIWPCKLLDFVFFVAGKCVVTHVPSVCDRPIEKIGYNDQMPCYTLCMWLHALHAEYAVSFAVRIKVCIFFHWNQFMSWKFSFSASLKWIEKENSNFNVFTGTSVKWLQFGMARFACYFRTNKKWNSMNWQCWILSLSHECLSCPAVVIGAVKYVTVESSIVLDEKKNYFEIFLTHCYSPLLLA